MSSRTMTISWEDAVRTRGWLHRFTGSEPGVADLRRKLEDSTENRVPAELSVAQVTLCIEGYKEIEERTLWIEDFVPGKGIVRDETPALSEAERQLYQRMLEALDSATREAS